MADAETNNFNFPLQVTGSNPGTWGSDVNNNLISPLDAILGGTLPVSMTSTSVTLTVAQWQNKAFKITGVLTTNLNLILPLSPNSVGSATSVGGQFIVDNETTGAFNITVITAATGSTGVTVPQGLRTTLYSDTINVWYANDGQVAKLQSTNGVNPNGTLAGVAASVNAPASVAWDGQNLWICTTTGTSTTAVWSQITGTVTPPQGYLTPNGNTPIITSDVIGGAAIAYVPFVGNSCPVWTGTQFSQLSFATLPLFLSAGSQAANGLYDVFAFISAGALAIAFGPSWGGGTGGNQSAGSCVRGTGAGSTDLTRINGILVNANTLTAANNGAGTFNIPAHQGTYLGTIYVDATAGQVTCHVTWGQSRKFGVWNYYNRVPIVMQGGDPTPGAPSWIYGLTTVRASNNAPAAWSSSVYNQGSGTLCNGFTVLQGVAEERISASFDQFIGNGGNALIQPEISIGLNSTTGSSGTVGRFNSFTASIGLDISVGSKLDLPPILGITTIQCLERLITGSGNGNFYGTQSTMNLRVACRG